ncbi:MAG: DNA internalization-related competence protein ComEC/Rec2 [Candidatus Scalindua sp.]
MTHRPLVGITTFFAIGISTNYLIGIPSFIILPTIFLTIIVCTFLFIFYSCQNAAGLVKSGVLTLLILIFLTGILYHHFRFNSYAGNNISNFINAEKILIHLRGVIISQPIDKFVQGLPLSSVVKHRKKMSNFLLRVETVERTSQAETTRHTTARTVYLKGFAHETKLQEWRDISGVIKVNVYPTKQEEKTLPGKWPYLLDNLNYGDRVELICKISIPSASRNPEQFDYKNYLKKQKPRIDAVASVLSTNNIKVLSEGNGNCFFTFVYSLKKQLNAVIERHVQEGSIPLVNSILLGDREKVPVNLMDGFLQTGTIHFLAISGLHVGILVISLHYFLRFFRFNIRYLAIIIILVVFLYAAITGMKSPIIRASIMVAVYYGAFIVNRRWDLTNSIAAALFIILLMNPSDLFNVGFQLSVLAVLGIIYCSNRLENFFWKSTLLVEKLQAKEERNEPLFLFKVYCRKTFCVSLGAWIGVMPLIAYYFHIVTPLTVFLNIIIFPLVWLILVGGFIVLILGLLFPMLVTPFSWLVSYSEIMLESLILLFSTYLKTFFYTSTPSWIWIIFYYLIVIFFILRERLKIKMVYIIIATLIVSNLFLFSGLFGRSQDCLKLTCFDVRHGASFFIQFPGGKNMLFDTGTKSNYDVGKFIVVPFLQQKGIKKIDTVVISHEHDDHCNGIPSIVKRFRVDNVFVNKFFLQSGNRVELLKLFKKEKAKTGIVADGLEIKGYDTAKIMVLNPPDRDTLRFNGFPIENLSINDSSSVLLINYKGYRILLCADIGEMGIETLLSGKDSLDADVIQVPHHGGFCEKTEDLVKRTRPKYAIISGSAKDISPSTIENYQKHGVNLFKTHEDGAVTFTIDEDGIKVSKFLDNG